MRLQSKLFIPGPCDVEEDVLDAMRQPVQRSYGPEWIPFYNETLSLLKQVFQTQNDIYMVPGPGTVGLEMALGSLLATGEKVIVGHNGFFGERMAVVAESNGLKVVHVKAPAGQQLAPGDLEPALTEHPDARLVALVHHETTTTVMNPLRELAAMTREAGRVLLLDAISSLGGTELPVDAWGIDVCVTCSNKCLEAPPGLAILSVGPRAWDLVNRHARTHHGWYLDLRTWRWYAENWSGFHPTPITMPTNNVMALRTSLLKIAKTGLSAHIAKHLRARNSVRTELQNLGFKMLVPDEYAAPTATAVWPRPEFTAPDLIEWLATERGLHIAGGIGELAGKIIRVGHVGKATTPEYLLELFSSVREFLRSKHIHVPVAQSKL